MSRYQTLSILHMRSLISVFMLSSNRLSEQEERTSSQTESICTAERCMKYSFTKCCWIVPCESAMCCSSHEGRSSTSLKTHGQMIYLSSSVMDLITFLSENLCMTEHHDAYCHKTTFVNMNCVLTLTETA